MTPFQRRNLFMHRARDVPWLMLSPSHRTLLESKLGRKMHARGKSEGIRVKHRVVGVKSRIHAGVRWIIRVHRLRGWWWLHGLHLLH